MINPKTEYSKRQKFTDQFRGINNNCYTPEEAIYPLLPFLKKEEIIWDCAYGTGKLAEHFKKQGFKTIGQENINFLSENDGYKETYDIIITNPPYSFKDQFLKRAFEIGKPFAFLLPITALEGIKRGKMFREKGIQLIIPDHRINFEIPSKKKSAWFATAWFCHGLKLPKDIIFTETKKHKQGLLL